MRRIAAAILGMTLAGTACRSVDPARVALETSAAAVATVRNGTYAYTYEGSGSLAGSYRGEVAFARGPEGAFFFKASLTPSPTPVDTSRRSPDGEPPSLVIASNGRELTARDEAIGRFSYGTYTGGSAHLANGSGYAVLFEFAEHDPFRSELAGDPVEVGVETIGGVECRAIRTTIPDFGGTEITWYIGVEDALPRGRDWVSGRPGAEGRFSFRIEGLTVNAPLGDDALAAASMPGDEIVAEDERDVGPGAPAPGWVLDSSDGASLDSEDLRGSVAVLAITSSWCRDCGLVTAALAEVAGRFADAPVRLVAVTAWEETGATPEVPGQGIEVLLRGERVAAEHKVSSPPAVFVIDPDGLIVLSRPTIDGSIEDLSRAVESAIRDALP
ncbi:MAG: redoxin domain-containing protein [Gemmatimonadota bacterium]|nr:redoxin domain-containing protein [Gemmatimonadota bacterium]